MLDKTNYIFISTGVLVVLLGFWLLAGGGNHSQSFWDADIMSVVRMNIAPATVVLGYIMTGYGIFARPFQKTNVREQ